MKTAVAFLAPAECLLVPTCSLAISKRAIFFSFSFFFFFDDLALQEAVKVARHTLQQPDQWNESGLQCAGCSVEPVGMRLLKCFFPNSSISSLLIQIFSSWNCFPSYFVQCSLKEKALGRRVPYFLMIDTPDDVCLSFPWPSTLRNGHTNMHTGTYSETANGSFCRNTREKQCPFTPKTCGLLAIKADAPACSAARKRHTGPIQET